MTVRAIIHAIGIMGISVGVAYATDGFYYRNVTGSPPAVAPTSPTVPNPGTDNASSPGKSLTLLVSGMPSESYSVGNTSTVGVSAANASGDVTYSATGLPTGLHVTGQGMLSGTFLAPGNFKAVVTARDAAGNEVSKSIEFTVRHQVPVLSVSPSANQSLISGLDYTATADVVNDASVLTWSLGSNPGTWLRIAPETGVISGVPPQGTTAFSYTVVGTDQYGRPAQLEASATLTQPTLQVFLPTTAIPGDTIQGGMTSNLPGPRFSYSAMPEWLSLNEVTGDLSGTVPLTPGTGVVTASAALGQATATASRSIIVSNVTVSPTTSLSVTQGQVLTGQVAASAGTGWSYAIRNKPSWLNVAAGSGMLSGTAAYTDTSATGLVAEASRNGVTVTSGAFTITVNAARGTFTVPGPVVVVTQNLPASTGTCTAFTVTNTGPVNLLGLSSSVTTGTGDFQVCTPVASGTPVCTGTLATKASCILGAQLKATLVGEKSGQITVSASNANPVNVALSGTVTAPRQVRLPDMAEGGGTLRWSSGGSLATGVAYLSDTDTTTLVEVAPGSISLKWNTNYPVANCIQLQYNSTSGSTVSFFATSPSGSLAKRGSSNAPSSAITNGSGLSSVMTTFDSMSMGAVNLSLTNSGNYLRVVSMRAGVISNGVCQP